METATAPTVDIIDRLNNCAETYSDAPRLASHIRDAMAEIRAIRHSRAVMEKALTQIQVLSLERSTTHTDPVLEFGRIANQALTQARAGGAS